MFDSAVTDQSSSKAQRAQEIFQARLRATPLAIQEIVNKVTGTVISDYLVSPCDMSFAIRGNSIYVYPDGNQEWSLHPHALTQLAAVLKYPKSYYNNLLQGILGIDSDVCRKKLVDDLEWHAHNAKLLDRRKQPAKYLCRCVGTELRGFVSRVFKRHLASAPLLRAYVNACNASNLVPFAAEYSPINSSLRCVLPLVFEPFDGEFVGVGISWSNSDFGGERLKVGMFLCRVYSTSSILLNSSISAVHIGPIIEESDIEMSSETARAELEAQKRAVTDAVVGQINADNIDKVMNAVRLAHAENLTWQQMRGELGAYLQKAEIEEIRKSLKGTSASRSGIEALPPISFDDDGDPVANRYWLSSIIAEQAQHVADPDRMNELMTLSGQVLTGGKAWRKQ